MAQPEKSVEHFHAETQIGMLSAPPPGFLNELLDKLKAPEQPHLRELVRAAEDMDFSAEESEELAPALLDYALKQRDSLEPSDKPAVYSAIRTGASMLWPHEAHRLLPLLEPGHEIETNMEALKMLGRIFEAQPPQELDQYPELAAEVRKIADGLLNPHALCVSEILALFDFAIYALAAMADTEVIKYANRIVELKAGWFAGFVQDSLGELNDYWRARQDPVGGPPRILLEQTIAALETDE